MSCPKPRAPAGETACGFQADSTATSATTSRASIPARVRLGHDPAGQPQRLRAWSSAGANARRAAA